MNWADQHVLVYYSSTGEVVVICKWLSMYMVPQARPPSSHKIGESVFYMYKSMAITAQSCSRRCGVVGAVMAYEPNGPGSNPAQGKRIFFFHFNYT